MTVIVFVIIFFGFFIFMADQGNKSVNSQWKIIITVNNIYGECTSCK